MRLLLPLVLVIAIDLAHCSCPTGYDLVNGNECRGYYTRTQGQTWGEAQTKCNDILGNPIIIHSEEDQKYWAGRIKNSPQWTVLGLTCNSTSKGWLWADGTKIDYRPPEYYPTLDEECEGDHVAVIRNLDGFWTETYANDTRPTDIFCSLPLRQPLPSADGCDAFGDDREDGVCYQVAATAENWKDAQTICASFGANVASVHNAQENSFIRRMAVGEGAIQGVYLGATLSGKTNEFEWLDGSKWDFDNSYPGFPMSGMGECLMMDTSLTSGYWANVDCSMQLPVACMRQQNYTEPTCSPGPWKEGQIMYTPGFPIDASTPCDYIMSVDAGKKVELEILLLEAVPVADHLILYENYFGANIIANLTGIINDKNYTTSSSNFMRVSWQPNGGQNVKGVMMTYRGV